MSVNSQKLHIQKWVAATPEQVFRAWTDPDQLLKWWGPQDVDCVAAEVDLKIGGAYRIANKLPDGTTLWISGNYEAIESPYLLVYTWVVEVSSPSTERVTVKFAKHDGGTNIELTHEKIPSIELRDRHQIGWHGCLQGISNHIAANTIVENAEGTGE